MIWEQKISFMTLALESVVRKLPWGHVGFWELCTIRMGQSPCSGGGWGAGGFGDGPTTADDMTVTSSSTSGNSQDEKNASYRISAD
jgi:hypothetical protein